MDQVRDIDSNAQFAPVHEAPSIVSPGAVARSSSASAGLHVAVPAAVLVVAVGLAVLLATPWTTALPLRATALLGASACLLMGEVVGRAGLAELAPE